MGWALRKRGNVMPSLDYSKYGPDESYYILENGGSEELRHKYAVYLHAANSPTIPDFPQDQLNAMDALFAREDLTDQQIVAEIAKILV